MSEEHAHRSLIASRRRPCQSPLRLAVVGLAAVGLLLVACVGTTTQPDLSSLYNRLASYHGPDRNPVVVIPGLTGSKLVDRESGQVVWGAFVDGSAKPNQPDDLRRIALPMREGARLADLVDGVQATEVLERIRMDVLGLPIVLRAYVEILATLGAGGYRDETLGESGVVDYGDDHYTCFQFPYDWRRDNVENAARLHEFLLEKRDYVRRETRERWGVDRPDVKFDIVAHSMGGLLLRYYLLYGSADLPAEGLPPVTWKGAELVERVVLVAPPNAGAAEALVQLVEGREYGPLLPHYPAALLSTFPASYQNLPRSRHGVLVDAATGETIDADHFDPALWQRFGWGLASPEADPVLAELLPDVADPETRRRIAREHLAKSLDRARRFTGALDRPAETPPGLDLFLVAGDAQSTPRRLGVDLTTGKIAVHDEGPGDGKVLRASALMDERQQEGRWQPNLVSPISWRGVLFVASDHLGMTRDPVFSDNVLYWLLEDPRR